MKRAWPVVVVLVLVAAGVAVWKLRDRPTAARAAVIERVVPHGAVAVALTRNLGKTGEKLKLVQALKVVGFAAQLQVHDDGRGFDPETGSRDAAGMGLPSMRERLALLDGRLDIHTALGAGTTITATVPLDGALGHRH